MRSLFQSVLLILVLTGLFVFYLLIKPGGPNQVNLGDNLTQGLLEAVGLLLTLPLFWHRGGRGDDSRFHSPGMLLRPGLPSAGYPSCSAWAS